VLHDYLSCVVFSVVMDLFVENREIVGGLFLLLLFLLELLLLLLELLLSLLLCILR